MAAAKRVYASEMMVRLLLYGYARGAYKSRKIQARTRLALPTVQTVKDNTPYHPLHGLANLHQFFGIRPKCRLS
jgi:hypothetical protein